MSSKVPSARTSVLAQHPSLRVLHYACSAGPHDPVLPERHEQPAIALVRRGSFVYHAQGRTHALVPGALLLGDQGQEYTCSHERAGGDDCLVFLYATPLLFEVSPRARGRFGQAVLPPLPRLATFFQITQAAVSGHLSGLLLDQLGLELAAEVLSVLGAAPAHPGSGASRRQDLDRAVAAACLIEERAAAPLCLDDVAGSVGLSPFHFLRLFRRELGVTPHQYLLRARVRHAAQLLLDTRLPVTEVAYRVGFGDLSNFVRTFHKLVGCPPLRFRHGGASARFSKIGALPGARVIPTTGGPHVRSHRNHRR